MGWPQVIYIVLTALSLGIIAAKHGQPQKPYSITPNLIGTAIFAALLYWGGFFG